MRKGQEKLIKRAEKLLPKEFVEKLMDESFTIEQLNHYSAGCFGSKTARKYLMTGMLFARMHFLSSMYMR